MQSLPKSKYRCDSKGIFRISLFYSIRDFDLILVKKRMLFDIGWVIICVIVTYFTYLLSINSKKDIPISFTNWSVN